MKLKGDADALVAALAGGALVAAGAAGGALVDVAPPKRDAWGAPEEGVAPPKLKGEAAGLAASVVVAGLAPIENDEVADEVFPNEKLGVEVAGAFWVLFCCCCWPKRLPAEVAGALTAGCSAGLLCPKLKGPGVPAGVVLPPKLNPPEAGVAGLGVAGAAPKEKDGVVVEVVLELEVAGPLLAG